MPRHRGFGLIPFRSPLLGESFLFSLPAATKMFQFAAFASATRRMTCLQHAGFSHSDIRASRVICTYARLFAAYHVLLRLQEPRHPPYALFYFVRAAGHTPLTGHERRQDDSRVSGPALTRAPFTAEGTPVQAITLLCSVSTCHRSLPDLSRDLWRMTDSNRRPPACKAGALAS